MFYNNVLCRKKDEKAAYFFSQHFFLASFYINLDLGKKVYFVNKLTGCMLTVNYKYRNKLLDLNNLYAI